jgi:hypothetical protein
VHTYRLSWWLTFWGLLTSLSLNWVLPAFDHHAAEYNPFHSHQVVGGSPAEREALLAAHHHGAGHAHDHHNPTMPAGTLAPESDTPTLVSLRSLEGVLALVTQAVETVAAVAAPLPLLPPALWLAVGTLSFFLFRLPTRPPEAPPRLAL